MPNKLRTAVTALTLISITTWLGGSAAWAGAPSTATSAAAADSPVIAEGGAWEHLWGPAQISGHYLKSHHKRWVSRTFDPHSLHTLGWSRCWNNHDGGRVRLRIYNVETRKYIGSSGWQPCDWTWWPAPQTGRYRDGEGLRFVLEAKGKAHTTYLMADGSGH